jgi:hypothetical protein
MAAFSRFTSLWDSQEAIQQIILVYDGPTTLYIDRAVIDFNSRRHPSLNAWCDGTGSIVDVQLHSLNRQFAFSHR